MNFHMNGMEKTLTELHGMLKTAKESIKKSANHVMMVQKENRKRKRKMPKGKGKGKVPYQPKPKPDAKVKSGRTPDDEFFHCHKQGFHFQKLKFIGGHR